MTAFRISQVWARLPPWLETLGEWRAARAAWMAWGVFALVVCVIVAVQPDRRTVTPEYRKASEKWWASEPGVYPKRNGFLYLPQAAIFYTPFRVLPKRVGEPLWRLVMIGSLAGALWWAAKSLDKKNRGVIFLLATLLVIPSCLASARNGQVNMPLAALYLLAALCVSSGRWWAAAACFAVSLGLKPISLAPMLLAGAAFPRLRLPMAAFTGLLLLLPFAHPDPTYVAIQYQDFVRCFLQAGRPSGHTWCDLAGMLRTFGLQPGDDFMWAVRIAAALATLAISLRIARHADRLRAALGVTLAGAIYLMLFNPRTETNSYVILAALTALAGAMEILRHASARRAAAYVILAIVWGSENYGWPIFPLTNLWLKALCTLALAAWLAPALWTGRDPGPFSGTPASTPRMA
jgi:hypothetical protein